MPSAKQQMKKELILTSDIPIKFIPRTTSYNLGFMVCLLCNLLSCEPNKLYDFLRDKIREGKNNELYKLVKDNERLFNSISPKASKE